MRLPRLQRPSAGLVVAVIALCLAVGGTATAASLITSKQIKNGTIQLVDINKRAQRALKGRTGAQGIQGPQGVQGLQGPAGANAVKHWAVVTGAGAVNRSSGGVSASFVNGAGQSQYQVIFPSDVRTCAYHVTPGNEGAISQTEVVTTAGVAVARMAAENNGVAVTTYDFNTGNRAASGFHIAVYC